MTFRIPSGETYQRNEMRVQRYEAALYSPEGAQVREYLQSRGLEEATWRHFRLGAVIDPFAEDIPAAGRLAIPMQLMAGVGSVRFRAVSEGDGPKYWSPAGTGTYLFNAPTVVENNGSRMAVAEGEIDCMTLYQCGIPAVGFPGAASWQSHHRHLFEGFESVTIPVDNDDKGAGQEFAEKVASAVPQPRVVMMPPGHDVNSYYNEAGKDALLKHLHLDGKENA